MTTPKGAALKATTLKCAYGCISPLTCPYPHNECAHCKKVRAAAVKDGADLPPALRPAFEVTDVIVDDKPYMVRHPLT